MVESSLSISTLIVLIIAVVIFPSSSLTPFDYDAWITNMTDLFKTTTTTTCDITNDSIMKIYMFSGKELFSIGEETSCLFHNMSYNLLILHKTDQNNSVYAKDKMTFFQFLDLTYFYYGFCVPFECQTTFTNIFRNETSDQITRDNLLALIMNNYTGYDFNITLYEKKSKTKEEKRFAFEATNPYYWLLMLTVLAFVIRIIIEVIGFFMYKRNTNNEEEQQQETEMLNTKNIFNVNKLLPDDVIFNEDVVTDIDGCFSPSKRSLNRLSNLFLEEKPSCFRCFYDICSYINCLKTLLGDSNYYYEERGIKMISLFQVFLLFWLTFNHSLYTMLIIPSKFIIQSKDFFESIWLFILKYSVFSSDLWVALDGMLTAYKLMSFIKKNLITKVNNNQRIPLTKFLFFYLNCLPRMFVFFIIFFLFYYYAENLSLFFHLPSFFQVFSNHVLLCRECMTNLSIIVNPFNIYFSNSSTSRVNVYCFKFVTVYLNEWISFTLIMIIVYISYLLKQRLFDITVLVLFLVNISLKFLTYLPQCGYKLGYMSLDYIFGSDCSLRYPHLMINVYFMGFLFGMAWFYYKDTTKANSLQSTTKYQPFNFCFRIVMCIDRYPLWGKNAIIVFSILMQLLASLYIVFFFDSQNFSFDINIFIQAMDCYEKDIFRFFFLLMILIIIIYPKDTLIKHLTRAYGFAQISRMGFCYYCFMDVFIYLFFTLFGSEFQLSYINGICLTIGLIFFLLVLNIILVIGFELPMRMILKNIFKTKENNDKESITS